MYAEGRPLLKKLSLIVTFCLDQNLRQPTGIHIKTLKWYPKTIEVYTCW